MVGRKALSFPPLPIRNDRKKRTTDGVVLQGQRWNKTNSCEG
jgi:hypothetical protein